MGRKKKIILCSSTAPHLQWLIQAIGSKYLLRIIFSQFLNPVWLWFREGDKKKKKSRHFPFRVGLPLSFFF